MWVADFTGMELQYSQSATGYTLGVGAIPQITTVFWFCFCFYRGGVTPYNIIAGEPIFANYVVTASV